MKKFYETPAVEFTGFNAEDVITTSVIDTYTMDAAAVAEKITNSTAAVDNTNAVSYGSYTW